MKYEQMQESIDIVREPAPTNYDFIYEYTTFSGEIFTYYYTRVVGKDYFMCKKTYTRDIFFVRFLGQYMTWGWSLDNMQNVPIQHAKGMMQCYESFLVEEILLKENGRG